MLLSKRVNNLSTNVTVLWCAEVCQEISVVVVVVLKMTKRRRSSSNLEPNEQRFALWLQMLDCLWQLNHFFYCIFSKPRTIVLTCELLYWDISLHMRNNMSPLCNIIWHVYFYVQRAVRKYSRPMDFFLHVLQSEFKMDYI